MNGKTMCDWLTATYGGEWVYRDHAMYWKRDDGRLMVTYSPSGYMLHCSVAPARSTEITPPAACRMHNKVSPRRAVV